MPHVYPYYLLEPFNNERIIQCMGKPMQLFVKR